LGVASSLAHSLASLFVGKRDLAAVECGEEPTESVGLTSVRARIGQLFGLKVLLDPGEPTEQLVAEDFHLGRRKPDRHDPRVGHRVLVSHEEPRLLLVRPSAGVSAPPGAAFSSSFERSRNYIHVLCTRS
jgi:hypothetical protein